MPRSLAAPFDYERSIFINCPFDKSYRPIFHALVYAAFDCGLKPRCALEVDDAGDVRLDKILQLIRESRLAVHDISRTEIDQGSRLPRFNMPFELGLFLGARRFGGGIQARKVCLVLDRERYRYQAFLSDIAGQDIRCHDGEPASAIKMFRAWLSALPQARMLPGGAEIIRRYELFQAELPRMLRAIKLRREEMTFQDYGNFVSEWLQVQR